MRGAFFDRRARIATYFLTRASREREPPADAASVLSALPRRAVSLAPTVVIAPANFNTLIGIDDSEALGKVIVSAHYSSGLPYNFELIAADGSRAQFSSISNLTDEVKIATVKQASTSKWPLGTFFTGSGVSGHVVRVSADGNTIQNPWVSLGNVGLLRGSSFVDDTGVWQFNLIVCTTDGYIFEIEPTGVFRQLLSVGTHLEGLVVLPNNPAKWGPFAGAILAGAEDQGRVYYVLPNLSTGFFVLRDQAGSAINVEDFDIVPSIPRNFFGVNYGTQQVVGVSAAQFQPYAGDLIVTMEFPPSGVVGLWRAFYDSQAGEFKTERIVWSNNVSTGQWEHVTFSAAGINDIPPIIDCETKALTVVNGAATASSSGDCLCVTF